jgi:hypothetical protein
VAGGEQGDGEVHAALGAKGSALVKGEVVFDAPAPEAGGHEAGGGRGEDDFAVAGGVVGVCVTDEGEFLLGAVRVEPEAQVRKVDSALAIMEFERRHAAD